MSHLGALGGYRDGARCLLLIGLVGRRAAVATDAVVVRGIVRRHGGLPVGSPPGAAWNRSRFTTPYLRNALWDVGYAVDTVETALRWSRVEAGARAVISSIRGSFQDRGTSSLVFGHVSHVYPDGASLYVSIIWPRSADPEPTLEGWRSAKVAASRAVLSVGGTISHQHGVGTDHLPYLEPEKSPAGLRLLDRVLREMDTQGVMNPGKLLPAEPSDDL